MYFECLLNSRTRSRRWIWGSQSIEERGKEFLRADMCEFSPIAEDELGLNGRIRNWSHCRGLGRNRVSDTSKDSS